MAKAVEQTAPNVAGKRAIAVESFAAALRQLPTILADNAGFDSSDLVARLKKEIYKGMTNSGLDLLKPGGGIADMREMGVIEAYKLKRAVVSSASEAAEVSSIKRNVSSKPDSNDFCYSPSVAITGRQHHTVCATETGEDVNCSAKGEI